MSETSSPSPLHMLLRRYPSQWRVPKAELDRLKNDNLRLMEAFKKQFLADGE